MTANGKRSELLSEPERRPPSIRPSARQPSQPSGLVVRSVYKNAPRIKTSLLFQDGKKEEQREEGDELERLQWLATNSPRSAAPLPYKLIDRLTD